MRQAKGLLELGVSDRSAVRENIALNGGCRRRDGRWTLPSGPMPRQNGGGIASISSNLPARLVRLFHVRSVQVQSLYPMGKMGSTLTLPANSDRARRPQLRRRLHRDGACPDQARPPPPTDLRAAPDHAARGRGLHGPGSPDPPHVFDAHGRAGTPVAARLHRLRSESLALELSVAARCPPPRRSVRARPRLSARGRASPSHQGVARAQGMSGAAALKAMATRRATERRRVPRQRRCKPTITEPPMFTTAVGHAPSSTMRQILEHQRRERV